VRHGVMLRQVQELYSASLRNLKALAEGRGLLFPSSWLPKHIVRGARRDLRPISNRPAIASVRWSANTNGRRGVGTDPQVTVTMSYPMTPVRRSERFMRKLEHMEEDLHQHIHLENNILFPRAITAESARLPTFEARG